MPGPAAITLTSMRAYVRDVMDLDSTDMPDTRIDLFARQATNRIEQSQKRWPFYEQDWTIATVAAQKDYTFASIEASVASTAIDEIKSIQGTDRTLTWIGIDEAENIFPSTNNSGTPYYYTFKATGATITRYVVLYPTPTAIETLTVRGYRKPADWVTTGAAASPDLPTELHQAVQNLTLGLCYIQQEETELGQYWQQVAAAEVEQVAQQLMSVPAPQPLILNGGPSARWRNRPYGRLRMQGE